MRSLLLLTFLSLLPFQIALAQDPQKIDSKTSLTIEDQCLLQTTKELVSTDPELRDALLGTRKGDLPNVDILRDGRTFFARDICKSCGSCADFIRIESSNQCATCAGTPPQQARCEDDLKRKAREELKKKDPKKNCKEYNGSCECTKTKERGFCLLTQIVGGSDGYFESEKDSNGKYCVKARYDCSYYCYKQTPLPAATVVSQRELTDK